MEFSTTILARIGNKEAEELADIMMMKLEKDSLDVSRGIDTMHCGTCPPIQRIEILTKLRNALKNMLIDYEFEQEVEVSYDPEPDDWR